MRAIPLSPWAAGSPPAPATPALTSPTRVDVAIVGAGYTGLSAALHLAERGTMVCVLDAGEPGYGGSGRNGGQLIPGLKFDPDDLEKKFGQEQGQALTHIISQTVEDVFALVKKHNIECDLYRNGWIQAAHDPMAVKTVHKRADQWEKRGVAVKRFDRASLAEQLGTDLYHGGWLEPRAAALNPLAYARGLARAALQAGAKIHGQSRVVRLESIGTRWRLHLETGATVDAGTVLLATNGYTDDLWPELRKTVVAANSFQVATTPLPESLRVGVLPGGQTVSDTRRVVRYFRMDRAGRLVMGGRGPFREPRDARDFGHLHLSVAQMFPQLKEVPFEFQWSGRVALTRDFLPHLHAPAPGVLACLGYNGRGVGMATSLGRLLAGHILDPKATPLPLPFTAITPFPVHSLHTVYVSIVIAWYQFLDSLGIG